MRRHRFPLRVAGTAVMVASMTITVGPTGASTSPYVEDIASRIGLGLTTPTFGAVVFDYNHDGWNDVFLGRHTGQGFLYRNDRGRFVRVATTAFPGGPDRHQCAGGDVNGDGRADLFCPIGGEAGQTAKISNNELWIQRPDGSFVDQGATLPSDLYGRNRHSLMLDANGDGRLDILIGAVSPRADGKPSPNRLFLNEGNGQWRDAPEFGLNVEDSVGGAGNPGDPTGGGNWPLGCLRALRADDDRWSDLLMCAQNKQQSEQRLQLFHNDQGHRFTDVTAAAGLGGIPALDAVAADVNRDGEPDVIVVNRTSVSIFVNQHGHFRRGFLMPVDHAFRVAVADANGDGHPDIYVLRTNVVAGPDVPDLLLLSNGAYWKYTPMRPPVVQGTVRDDEVYPFRINGGNKSAFLVLHGSGRYAGPVQVITVQ